MDCNLSQVTFMCGKYPSSILEPSLQDISTLIQIQFSPLSKILFPKGPFFLPLSFDPSPFTFILVIL